MPTLAVPPVLTMEDDPISAAHPERGRIAREESRRALADILCLLGYPEEWAEELERLSYRKGKAWRKNA